MNRAETIELMQEIEARYPNFAPSNPKKTVDVWLEEFEDMPYEVVLAGVKTFASTDTKGFPPSIGQVKDKMFSLATMNMPNVNEAWDLVQRTIADSTYHAEERFEKLPPFIQKVVVSPTTLQHWGQSDYSTLGTVVYSQFVKTYNALYEREKEKAKIPKKVMALIENASFLMIENKMGDDLY